MWALGVIMFEMFLLQPSKNLKSRPTKHLEWRNNPKGVGGKNFKIINIVGNPTGNAGQNGGHLPRFWL